MLCAHALKTGVFLADDRVGDAHLELLQTHNLLLQCAPGNEAVHVHYTFLSLRDNLVTALNTHNASEITTKGLTFSHTLKIQLPSGKLQQKNADV